jgi:citronellyl-CoA synthetase
MKSIRRKYTQLAGLYRIITTTNETPLSLGAILEKQAKKFKNLPLILFEDRTITYREFNESANRCAAFFISQGFRKGDVVALVMGNRPDLLKPDWELPW